MIRTTTLATALALIATSAHAVVEPPPPATFEYSEVTSGVLVGTLQDVEIFSTSLKGEAQVSFLFTNYGLTLPGGGSYGTITSLSGNVVELETGVSTPLQLEFFFLNQHLLKMLSFEGQLSPGSYSFRINGEADGGAPFGVQFNASVSTPVPEPSPAALLAAGLMAITFLRQRKRV